MDFLNPMFLFLLAAAGLPLLIHLLSRRKIPTVPFSSLRFLRRSDRRSMRKIDLRRMILLLLRMAAVASVALAFSRPVVRGGLASLFPGEGARDICVLVDRSMSMAVTGEGGQLEDRAASALVDIAEGAASGDRVTVMLFDEGTETLFEGERFTPSAAEELAERITPSYLGTSLGRAAAGGLERLGGGRRGQKELYLISDLQRSGLGPGAGESAGEDAGGPVRAFIVPVQPGPGQNVSIDEVLTPTVSIHRGETARISVKATNHSASLEARFPLRIGIDGRTVAEREMMIAPSASATAVFELPVTRTGWLRGEAYKPPDRQKRDDRRYFTVFSREKAGVLLIGGEGDIYLRAALDPVGGGGDISLAERSWQQLTTADLRDAEIVVTGSGAARSDTGILLVRRFVLGGGKALVFLTEDNVEEMLGLSAGRLEASKLPRLSLRTLEPPARASGLLRPFGREDLAALSRLRFSGGVEVRGAPPEGVELSFRGGAPFLWTERYGSGTFVFMAADPVPDGGDLVLSPFFLPLVQQAVLASGTLDLSSGGLRTGGEIVVGARPGTSVKVRLADGEERLVLETARADEGLKAEEGVSPSTPMKVPAGGEPGFIEVTDGEDTVLVAAVNPPAATESMPDLMEPAEAADSLGLEHFAVLGERVEREETIREAREGREISAAFAVAAILLLAAELVISQRRDMAA